MKLSKRKWRIFERRFKKVSDNISDWKFAEQQNVKVRLLHNDKDKLVEDIRKLNIFELLSIEEQEIEKSKPRFGGQIRKHC